MHDDPPVPEVFAYVARSRGHAVAADDVTPVMTEIDEYYAQEYLRDGDFWCDHDRAVQIWLDMYNLMAGYCGIADSGLAQAVYDEYLKPCNWSLFPDAPSCLKALKRLGFRLGVISNWDATLENLLRDMGYLPYFDEVVSSAAVGYRKPSKEIFDIALERMNMRPEQAIHVGDLPEADGEGAASAGIRPIIIDRNGSGGPCKFERISSLTALPGIL